MKKNYKFFFDFSSTKFEFKLTFEGGGTIVSRPQVFQVFFFGQIPDSGMFRYQVFQVFFFGQIPETPKTQITCKITN